MAVVRGLVLWMKTCTVF